VFTGDPLSVYVLYSCEEIVSRIFKTTKHKNKFKYLPSLKYF